MPILATGNTFATGDNVTAAMLNAAVNDATFATGAVDNATTQLSGGAIIVKDGGITPAKLSTGGPSWTTTGAITITGTLSVTGATAITGAFSATGGINSTSIGASTPSSGAFTTISASSLTGYVKGAGSSNMTAASTIPFSDISGTASVSQGGTGVGTITGYVKGSGTSAFTGAATIPVSDITGTVTVSQGGTGVGTITGYVKGSGTSAFTGATAIPFSDITGTVPIAQGGTGQTTAALGRVALNQGLTVLTDSTTIATDCSLNNVFSVTLGDNRTLGAPSNAVTGATYLWVLNQDGTGGRTLAYNSVFKFPGGSAPTLSTGANKIDVLSGVYNGSVFLCSLVNDLR